MNTHRTLSRPYAKAAFNFALDNDLLNDWQEMLRISSLCMQEIEEKYCISLVGGENYQCVDELIISIISGVDERLMQENFKNYLYVLAENRRVTLLPQIYEIFLEYLASFNKRFNVEVTFGVKVTDKQKQDFFAQLESRLLKKYNGNSMTISSSVDESLLGGVLVKIDDVLIDHTIRKQLTQLQSNLCDS